MRTGWKVEIPLSCVVLCTFPDMSSSCARATISVIVGNEDRELNESLFIGMGTSGCDNSQRGVSEGVSPATFASPLSVNLPVHLSVCHTMLTRLTNSIYKGNMCHMYCAMRKSSTLNVTHWSAILLLFNIFHQFLIITPVVEIKNSKVFYQSCLVDSHQTDSSITQPLHLSLTLIRNPFQMSSQFFFHNKMQCGKKKREDRHCWNKKCKEITRQTVSPHYDSDMKISKVYSSWNKYSSIYMCVTGSLLICLCSCWHYVCRISIAVISWCKLLHILQITMHPSFHWLMPWSISFIKCRITALETNQLIKLEF